MKNNKFLFVYGLLIIIALICIMFLIPDSFFLGQYQDEIELLQSTTGTSEEKEEKTEFTDFSLQQEHLLNGNYEYEYNILDSMTTTTYTYKCSGQVNKEVESGSCTSPETVSYTEITKK